MALEERIALRGLRLHDQTKRGDKGNVAAIVDKAGYIEATTHHKKFKSKLSHQLSHKVNPKRNAGPRVYGLPKTNKDEIVDFTGRQLMNGKGVWQPS